MGRGGCDLRAHTTQRVSAIEILTPDLGVLEGGAWAWVWIKSIFPGLTLYPYTEYCVQAVAFRLRFWDGNPVVEPSPGQDPVPCSAVCRPIVDVG